MGAGPGRGSGVRAGQAAVRDAGGSLLPTPPSPLSAVPRVGSEKPPGSRAAAPDGMPSLPVPAHGQG